MLAAGRGRASSPQGCGVQGTIHEPVDGPESMCKQTALSRLRVYYTHTHTNIHTHTHTQHTHKHVHINEKNFNNIRLFLEVQCSVLGLHT